MSENNLPRVPPNNSHVYVVLPAQSQTHLESNGNSQFSHLNNINNLETALHQFPRQPTSISHQQNHPSLLSSVNDSGSLNQTVQLAETLERINHFPPKEREVLVNSVLASVIKSTSELQGSLQNIVKLVNSVLINQNNHSNSTQPVLIQQQQNIEQKTLINFLNQNLQPSQQQQSVNLVLSPDSYNGCSNHLTNPNSNAENYRTNSENVNHSIPTVLHQLNNLIQKENSLQNTQLNANLPQQNHESASLSAINHALTEPILSSSSSSPKSMSLKSPNQDYFALPSLTSSPAYSQSNLEVLLKSSPVDTSGSVCYTKQASVPQNENKSFEASTSTIRSLLSNPSLQWKPSNPLTSQSQTNFSTNGLISTDSNSISELVTTEETKDKSKSYRVPPGSLLIADSANQEGVSSGDEQTESCSPHSSPCDSPRVSTWNSFNNVDALWQDSDTQISTIRRCCNNLNLDCNTNGGCNASCSDSVDDDSALPRTSSTNSIPRVWRLASGNGSAVESGVKNAEVEPAAGWPPTKLRRSTSSYDNNDNGGINKRFNMKKKKLSQRSIENDCRVNSFLTDPDSDQKASIQKASAIKSLKRLSQSKGSNAKIRLASLQQQFPSSYSQIQLLVVTQPEEQHRARYMTEGSRGAIKDRSGNSHPEVQLVGWSNPFTLQVFLATDVGRVRPHGFYQSCKVFGKSSTPCNETDFDGTNVIEIPCQPDSSVTTISLDCVGILKLRNADVEHRVGPKGGKNKSVRARLVFRVSLPRPDGSQINLQTVSDPILCTQPVGSPEISRISMSSGNWKGGYDLFIIGKNFTKGTKVLFQEVQEGQASPLWEAEAIIDSEYFQQNHLICEVPQFKCKLKVPVTVQIILQCSKRISEPHYFSYIPDCNPSEEGPSDMKPIPEYVQITCSQSTSRVQEESSLPLILSASSGQLSHAPDQLMSTGSIVQSSDIEIAKRLFNDESDWNLDPTVVTNQSNWSVTHNDSSTADWSVHHPSSSNSQNWSVSALPVTSEQSWEEVVSSGLSSQPHAETTWNQSREQHQTFTNQVLPSTSVDSVRINNLEVASVTDSSTYTISEQLNHQNFPNSVNDNGVSVDVRNWDPSLPTINYEQMDWTKSVPENNHFLTTSLEHSQLEFLNVIPEESSSLDKSEEVNSSVNAGNPILTYADVSNYFDI